MATPRKDPREKKRTGPKPRVYSPQDREFVSRAVKAGSRINDIADCLNITDDTLRKHFRYEITTARETLKASAIGVLENSLKDGSLDAAKFVLARVAGWSEKQLNEHTGKDGKDLPAASVAVFALPDNGRS